MPSGGGPPRCQLATCSRRFFPTEVAAVRFLSGPRLCVWRTHDRRDVGPLPPPQPRCHPLRSPLLSRQLASEVPAAAVRAHPPRPPRGRPRSPPFPSHPTTPAPPDGRPVPPPLAGAGACVTPTGERAAVWLLSRAHGAGGRHGRFAPFAPRPSFPPPPSSPAACTRPLHRGRGGGGGGGGGIGGCVVGVGGGGGDGRSAGGEQGGVRG